MRAACSLILSASLLFPGAALPLTRTAPDKNAKQAAQEPQPVTPVVKQPLAFGLEDSTPVKLRINRNISSADAQVNETVDFGTLRSTKSLTGQKPVGTAYGDINASAGSTAVYGAQGKEMFEFKREGRWTLVPQTQFQKRVSSDFLN